MNQTLLPTPNQVSPYALSHNNGILTLKVSPLSSLSETLSPSGAICGHSIVSRRFSPGRTSGLSLLSIWKRTFRLSAGTSPS